MPSSLLSRVDPLRAVKILHTVVWAFFVACILAIPVLTALSRYRLAALFSVMVAVEVGILLVNGMRCPLTDVAARYSPESSANFDIYLPEWLARNDYRVERQREPMKPREVRPQAGPRLGNKTVFGSLYVAALAYLLARWHQA